MSKDLARRVHLAQLPAISDKDFAELLGTPYSTWIAAAKHIPGLPVLWIGRRKLRPVAATLAALARVSEK
jgi:hypothetical protein